MCRTSLSAVFHGVVLVEPGWLGGQVVARSGGSQALVEQSGPGVCQGQARGRCKVSRRAELAILAGTAISWRRMVAGGRLGSVVSVERARRRG